jgi:hypothetical protein
MDSTVAITAIPTENSLNLKLGEQKIEVVLSSKKNRLL